MNTLHENNLRYVSIYEFLYVICLYFICIQESYVGRCFSNVERIFRPRTLWYIATPCAWHLY